MNKFQINVFTWSLAALNVGLALIVWGQDLRWQIIGASTYSIFPVFGLIAFSLMWGHYIVIVAKVVFKIKMGMLSSYFAITHGAVLLALLLHPGLLIWQLWRDGLGLPPGSYLTNYIAPGLGWVGLLGTVSLLTFLAYELRVKYENRSWWKYVVNASELAMLAIYYHGLKLGAQLQSGWYKFVWYFYGLTLVAALGYIHYRRWYVKNKAKERT